MSRVQRPLAETHPDWSRTIELQRHGDACLADGEHGRAIEAYDAAMKVWSGRIVQEELNRKLKIATLIKRVEDTVASNARSLRQSARRGPKDVAHMAAEKALECFEELALLACLDSERAVIKARLSHVVRGEFTRAMRHMYLK
eukprot:SAG11_NODE_16794_length_537_cov_1.413242_1_plen_142_part_01